MLRDQLGKMGVPAGVPFALPTSLTPEGIADAAYSTAKGYAERAIQSETGIPVQLPRKLTAKEISKSVAGLIPTDLGQVVDTALAIGAQAAASAVTSLLAGTAIGSVIPGLGTLVGLGVAIGVQAFKKLLRSPPPPYARKCKTQWSCPTVPPNLDGFGLIAWASDQIVPLSRELAIEQSHSYCGTGPAMDCRTWLSEMRSSAMRAVQGTIPGMSLPAVRAAIATLQDAQSGYWIFDVGRPGYGATASHKVQWSPYAGTASSLDPILAALRARESFLVNLIQHGPATIEPTRLSFILAAEIAAAALQVQFQDTPENVEWFVTLVRMRHEIAEREKARLARMYAEQERGRRVAQEKLAGPHAAEAKRRHEKQIAAFQRAERQQATAPPPRPSAITWPVWFRAALAAQRARRAVPPPPPIPPVLPPGLPAAWVNWANSARLSQARNLPIPAPPAVPPQWAA